MGARKQVDDCIFCGENPCLCSGAAKKVKPGKRRKSDITPGEVDHGASLPREKPSRSKVFAAMQANATELRPQIIRPAAVKPKVSSEEEAFNQAIKVLAPILHDDELSRYSSILGTEEIERRNRGVLERREEGVPQATSG